MKFKFKVNVAFPIQERFGAFAVEVEADNKTAGLDIVRAIIRDDDECFPYKIENKPTAPAGS